jgi:hypothetical protein
VWFKVELDRLIAEIGALFLIVGVLHLFFDLGLRDEMLREVARTVTGSTILHDAGLESCSMNSRQVEDRVHWARCSILIIGRLYSTRFLKDFNELIKERCELGLPTVVTVLAADGSAAKYLQDPGIGAGTVQKSAEETAILLADIDRGAKKHIRLSFHDRIMRYSFIQTNEYIWITFYRNSPGRATVPSFKVRAGTPLYDFFNEDIQKLLEHSSEAKASS